MFFFQVNNSCTSTAAVSSISAAGISNVDFDINEVSELLSKVKQHFQTNEKKLVLFIYYFILFVLLKYSWLVELYPVILTFNINS